GRLHPVGGGTDILWGSRSIEHLEELRLEAWRKKRASMAGGAGKVFQVVGQLREGDPVAALGGEIISLHLREILVSPLEEAAGLLNGIDDVSHLQSLREEMLMDEKVVVRKKDAEAGMRVVPADDVQIGKKPVALAGDLFPGIVGVGKARRGVGVVLGFERLRDPDERCAGGLVQAFLAQQDSPQLDGRVEERVPLDGVGRAVIDEDR